MMDETAIVKSIDILTTYDLTSLLLDYLCLLHSFLDEMLFIRKFVTGPLSVMVFYCGRIFISIGSEISKKTEQQQVIYC